MLKWQNAIPDKVGTWYLRRKGHARISAEEVTIIIDGISYDSDGDPIKNDDGCWEWAGPHTEKDN